jgi:hypothetical protein
LKVSSSERWGQSPFLLHSHFYFGQVIECIEGEKTRKTCFASLAHSKSSIKASFITIISAQSIKGLSGCGQEAVDWLMGMQMNPVMSPYHRPLKESIEV